MQIPPATARVERTLLSAAFDFEFDFALPEIVAALANSKAR
jgi:hypothetical protein